VLPDGRLQGEGSRNGLMRARQTISLEDGVYSVKCCQIRERAMAYKDRLNLIREIEGLRQSKVVCYLTSLRYNLGAAMADDQVRVLFDHLLLLPSRPIKQLDVFLCSNGGSGVLPWRIISLFREFSERVTVLIPYRAYSAATMVALGADEIVMHPFAEMGPIDPTVSNDFNPVDANTKQRIGISVEDVKAYVGFIKETVGIRHEDELVKAIEILAQKVHPLALGNVERFISQSRLVARKILLTHMSEETDQHKIDDTIETLASKLYFHGHPINRREARVELGLKVAEIVPPALETAIWKLYLDFEQELRNGEPFDPMVGIFNAAGAPQPPQPGQACIIPPGTTTEEESKYVIIESASLSSAFDLRRRFVVAGNGPQFEPLIRAETLSQGWSHQQAPAPAPAKKRK
jgi:Serine dehydrogenase proteinase